MRVSEIRVKQIRVNQGLGVEQNFSMIECSKFAQGHHKVVDM